MRNVRYRCGRPSGTAFHMKHVLSRLPRGSALVLGLVAIAAVPRLIAAEPHPSLPSPGLTDGLGVNIHFTDPRPGEMEMLAEGGFRWVRMDLAWGGHRTGARAVRLLGLRPAAGGLAGTHGPSAPCSSWTTATRCTKPIGRSPPHDGRQAYARWAAAAASHFQGRGILWEIWNEPNIRGFWQPEPNVAALHGDGAGRRPGHPRGRARRGDHRAGHLHHRPAVPGRVLPGRAARPGGMRSRCIPIGSPRRRRRRPSTPELRRLIDRYAPAGQSIPDPVRASGATRRPGRGSTPDRQGRMLAAPVAGQPRRQHPRCPSGTTGTTTAATRRNRSTTSAPWRTRTTTAATRSTIPSPPTWPRRP